MMMSVLVAQEPINSHTRDATEMPRAILGTHCISLNVKSSNFVLTLYAHALDFFGYGSYL